MEKDSLLLRGELHEVYGEDTQFYSELGNEWIVAAVMDGCSSGKESYFASSLYVKLLRKNCKTLPLLAEINSDLDLDGFTPERLGKYILNQIFQDIKKTRKLLLADKIELLSTLLLVVFHKPSKNAYLCASGDGFIQINNEFIDLDQNNIPDYMSYHLNLTFEQWIQMHTRTFLKENVDSVIISTDGIQKYLNNKKQTSNKIDTVSYFLQTSNESLKEKNEFLKNKYNLHPYDDVSIISLNFKK